jgi:outer membrane protein
MKKQLLVIALLLSTSTVYGQKFGYIDSEFILSKMPDYSLAQKQLD